MTKTSFRVNFFTYGGNVIFAFRVEATSTVCENDPNPNPDTQRLLAMIQDTLFNQNQEENIYHNHEAAYRMLRQNDTLLALGGDTVAVSLQNFYSLTALSNIGLLQDVNQYLMDGDIANALLLNNQIDSENLMEANSIFVNELCIEAGNGAITPDSAQQAELLAIAYQMPVIGGEAVYRARAILWLDVDDTQLNYRLPHTGQSMNIATAPVIYPNPNNGIFYLNCLMDGEHPANAEVRDVTGRIIMTKNLESGNTHQLHVSNKVSGIYFLYLNSGFGSNVYKVVVK